MIELFCIQTFDGEVWKTYYVTTSVTDSTLTYMNIRAQTKQPVRAVSFVLDSFDPIPANCRDFKVLALRK
jgi:hypothetical protein